MTERDKISTDQTDDTPGVRALTLEQFDQLIEKNGEPPAARSEKPSSKKVVLTPKIVQ